VTAEWHFITGEYPPQRGGVGDYTKLVASRLAEVGERVHVWCPGSNDPAADGPGVTVHRELGTFSVRTLRRVDRLQGRAAGRRVIVQWVAQAYGWRSLNLPFCLWLWKRAIHDGEWIEIMVHEPYLAFWEGSWRQSLAAAIHRIMTIVLLRAARGVWVATPVWEARWRPFALGRNVPFRWLPVPSNIPVVHDPPAVSAVRLRFADAGQSLVGHFGTAGRATRTFLGAVLPAVLHRSSTAAVLLMGPGGEDMARALRLRYPALTTRVHATGYLDHEDVSQHLAACDVIIQPYEDGVTTRRGSVMAALSHGLAIVTSDGRFTEPVWREGDAVVLTAAGDTAAAADAVVRLLARPSDRARLGASARALYRSRFDVQHTVDALRAGFSGVLSDRVAVELG
jgi:glycosyltransferase involved in cell wall biosynthesis